MNSSKIALGTVQFGLDYGVSNNQGQVTLDQGVQILDLARNYGVDTIDTAIAYGESEFKLGQMGVEGFKIVSKLPLFPNDELDACAWIKSELEASCQRLGVSHLDGVLLHQPSQLLEPVGKEIIESLLYAKSIGITNKIGISIYDYDSLEEILNIIDIDIVQCPFNIIDQRLVTTGWLDKLKSQGIEVHTRSAFLQGLLLMKSTERPEYFERWKNVFNSWDVWLNSNGITPLQACINFSMSFDQIDKVVLGVDSTKQLRQIFESTDKLCTYEWPNMAVNDPRLINPSNWKLR